jgi:murein DD-endopeptidase MepM/ murein hydrolase activator NlpD
MRHGLNLITFFSIILLGFILVSNKSIKPQEKIIYVNKPVYIERTKIKEVVKEVIKEAPFEVDSLVVPEGLPVLAEVLKKPINQMSGFGYRVHPVLKKRRLHTGIDMGCKTGSPVISTAQGKIVRIQYSPNGYGNNIVVKHNDKYTTLYAHLSRISVKVNQKVRKGQVIGYSGNTGISTSPHLHYEVIVNNEKVDPILYF